MKFLDGLIRRLPPGTSAATRHDISPPPPPPAKRAVLRPMLLIGAGLLWLGLVGIGARSLLNYENTPGAPATAPSRWPSSSRLARRGGRFALVMLAHPSCPCTRASLAELEILMAKLQGKLDAFVVLTRPDANEAEVRASELWWKASAIPDVTVIHDDRGMETRRFGARVSGQALLYASSGRLVFDGGITAARGHQGDNAGVDAVISIVRGEAVKSAHTSAFGCSLQNPEAQELRRGSSWKKQ